MLHDEAIILIFVLFFMMYNKYAVTSTSFVMNKDDEILTLNVNCKRMRSDVAAAADLCFCETE